MCSRKGITQQFVQRRQSTTNLRPNRSGRHIDMADYFQILSVIVAVFLAVYYYLTSTFDFWKDRGVVGPRPIPGFGNIKDVMLRKISIGDYIARLYEKYKNEPMIGIFVRGSPSLILCDLDLIKDVLIKDFSTFDNRGLNVLERVCTMYTIVQRYMDINIFFNIV